MYEITILPDWLHLPVRIPFINASLAVFLCIAIVSCSKHHHEKKSEPGKFFDLVAYFSNEADKLNTAKPEVTKTITKDGETETQILSRNIDWNREFKIFKENGINKPAWKEVFSADTNNHIISYKTQDGKISVKEIIIQTDSTWQPTAITIKRNAKNFLYTSEQTLNYIPGKSYRLDSKMHVRWTFDTRFSVEAKFTAP